MCEGVHLLVVRSNDYVEVLPVGRHVEAKMIVMGKQIESYYFFFFYADDLESA